MNSTSAFNPKSKKETIIHEDGTVGYTKINNVKVARDICVHILTSIYVAKSDIRKCKGSEKNTEKICAKDQPLCVIDTLSGHVDDKKYVVFSDKYGPFKRKWREIAVDSGKPVVRWVGSDSKEFKVVKTGTFKKEEAYMIELPKGGHVWISEGYVARCESIRSENSDRSAYIQPGENQIDEQGSAENFQVSQFLEAPQIPHAAQPQQDVFFANYPCPEGQQQTIFIRPQDPDDYQHHEYITSMLFPGCQLCFGLPGDFE